MIRVTNLYKQFGPLEVLKGVDLSLSTSGIVTILGPNGSGKTTLIKSILGMVIPDKGEIYVNDYHVNGKVDYRKGIDYLPQIARFPENLTVKELVALIKDLRQAKTRDHQLIQHFRLEPFLEKKLGTLSGGTRQKVNLLLTMMFDSDVVILDEPTSGLDPVALTRLKELLLEEKKRGKLIIVTTHILDFVENHADQVIFILEGAIYYQGTVEELLQKGENKTLERAIANILEQHNV